MTIYGNEKDATNSRGFGCIPMFHYVKEMRIDAVRQAKKAFGDSGRQVYAAMGAIGEVMLYARKQGLAALSADEFFRDGPYVLDIIEEKLGDKVPMRPYLEFGLEHISKGEEPEDVAGLMTNRYFASGYMEADALTGYLYCISILGMVYGISYAYMLEYFASLIPDCELSEFNGFAGEKRKQIEGERYRYVCEKLEKKFAVWDADHGKTVEMDSMRSVFNDMLKVMDDNVAASLFGNICDTDICHSLLGADVDLRKHMMELLDGRHRLRLMEHWMDMKFNAKTMEKCMEAMGKVMRKGISHLCMKTAEKLE
ncbi:MAG: hypothetical protein OSJ73_17460 [Lachnospiraceae bacterium]|nr:hypothetical protein [Lachnospiraceae bacterium]